jgi:peptide deformylase
MAVLPVLKMGTLSLLDRSAEITEFACAKLYDLITDLKDVLAKEGGVGIAAPQIGVNQRVVIFGFENSVRYPSEKPVPFTVLINPVITPLSEEKIEDWEGCLSVPGLRGKVSRYQKIHYTGFNEEGERIERVADNFHARIVQHECDHLDGILYPERMTNMRDFGFESVIWERLYGTPYKENK